MRSINSVVIVAVATFLAGPAGADDVKINATLPKACEMSGSLSGTIPNTPFVIHDVGILGFSCNYVGSASFSMTTASGTYLSVPGEPGSKVQYQIRWNVPPNMPWNSAGSAATFGPWVGTTAASPNTVRSEKVQVRFFDPLTIGGNYTDTVTFTIAP